MERRTTQNLKIQESLEEREQVEEISQGLKGVFTMIKEKLNPIESEDVKQEDKDNGITDPHMYEICECGQQKLKEKYQREIPVEYDWYFITFAGFNTEVFFKAKLTPEEVTNNMLSCYFIFGLQAILLFFVCVEQTDLNYFCQEQTDVTIVRFCSCAMLHTMIMGELRSALEKLKYVCDHDQHFMCENQAALSCIM